MQIYVKKGKKTNALFVYAAINHQDILVLEAQF